MSAKTRAKYLLDQTFTADTAVNANQVVVASTANVGNVMTPAAAGALSIIGVVLSIDSKNVATVRTHGVAQCRALTGTAIAVGDRVKVADTSGRITKITPAAAGAGTLKGIVGISLSAIASGDASDTLCDVMLTNGVIFE